MNDLFINGIFIDWDRVEDSSYLKGIEAIKDLDHIGFKKPVTLFTGENGSGKSTLLEALAVSYGFNPEGGTRNYSFSTYDSHSGLYSAVRLDRGIRKARHGYFLRAESFYNVATKEEEYSRGPGGRPMHYHERSHGESFLLMAQENFRGQGLYILDEPEAALSPRRQLTLLLDIVNCAAEGAQFFIATHSPILLGMPGAEILSFDDGAVHPVEYGDSDSYIVTEMFINHRERVLKDLLETETDPEE